MRFDDFACAVDAGPLPCGRARCGEDFEHVTFEPDEDDAGVGRVFEKSQRRAYCDPGPVVASHRIDSYRHAHGSCPARRERITSRAAYIASAAHGTVLPTRRLWF